ncbi:uncharacterized protein LOC110023912 [Phalaenopsis equestris]|uniref:uncharacterized protein LOC110023912 n=1 Tax=Phalaenopsis equestris TaxID=78828 RepID=UPI0009E6192A|nr:uncharacterized protein LOC110023912 [Phalaenopsis equestris]
MTAQWTDATQTSFDTLKDKLSQTPVLALLEFNQWFEVECDASIVGIRETSEFTLFTDSEDLKFLNNHRKLKGRHGPWVEFLWSFLFLIKHKAKNQNRVADALGRDHLLIASIQTRVIGFEVLKELYETNEDIRVIWG